MIAPRKVLLWLAMLAVASWVLKELLLPQVGQISKHTERIFPHHHADVEDILSFEVEQAVFEQERSKPLQDSFEAVQADSTQPQAPLADPPIAVRPIAAMAPIPDQDFPDPSLIKAGDTWYAFGTQGNGQHIQLAKSNANDFNTWGIIPGKDALPTLPAWVNGSDPAVWAPDVVQLGADYNNRYLMYFSAQTNSAAGLHCVGAALSNNGVEGPYDDVLDSPIACPTGQGGAIDSSGFQDSDGTRYVVYKIDGNAIGSGGLCNNGGPDYKPTPLMLQKVGPDGVTLVDSPVQLLDRDAGDGPLIEAPSITRMANGKYVMYFSSSCYSTDFYDVTYATADAVAGPWTKYGPLFTTQNFGVTAPGGADIDADGTHMVFHAGPLGKRQMYIATVSVSGNTVTG